MERRERRGEPRRLNSIKAPNISTSSEYISHVEQLNEHFSPLCSGLPAQSGWKMADLVLNSYFGPKFSLLVDPQPTHS